MEMLDHLLEIRDNPVRAQLLEASRVRWICRLFCGSSVFTALCSRTQRKHNAKGWSPELATFLPFPPLCCYTLHHLNTRVYGGIRLIQTNLFARSVSFFFFFDSAFQKNVHVSIPASPLQLSEIICLILCRMSFTHTHTHTHTLSGSVY